MLPLNPELLLPLLVIKPRSPAEEPMWLVVVILGALLAQKKIAGKLETAAAWDSNPPQPPSGESYSSFVYSNSFNTDMTSQVFINKP